MKRVSLIVILMFLLGASSSSIYAQYYFGRNKIQYNSFDWHILKTEHFDIYYYPEMREMAEIGAAAAEETYTFLEDKFNHNINRRIPLIFYSNHAHFQQTNTTPSLLPEGVGGFFEFMKGRVVIPANGSVYQFKRVIRHELVHVFTHSLHYRVLKNHRKLNHPSLPLWFVEGLAEYWSIGWNSETESIIRDAVLNNYLYPTQYIYQIQGTFLMYKEGQAILKYIADTYGEHKIIQLIENTWKTERFSNVMKLTIGVDYKEFDKEWIYSLKKNKYPLLEDHDLPEMVTNKITEEGINTKPAYYRLNGEPYIAFISNRIGYSNIYTKPLSDVEEKIKPHVIIEGERSSEFESFHILKSKIDISKHGVLAFVSKSGETDVLYTYDIKRDKILKSFKWDKLVSFSSPAWSSGGTKLAFTAINFAGMSDLYIVDVPTGKLFKLTNDYYDDHDPVWSNDGRTIYFSSDRTVFGEYGNYNIFKYGLESGEISFITYGPHNDLTPSLSPDGKYLAFTSDRDGVFNIWMLTLNGSEYRLTNTENQLKKVTHFTTAAYDPVWTDNNSIVFTAFENFSFQIREQEDVVETYEQIAEVTVDSMTLPNSFWTIRKLDGKSSAERVKYKPKFNLDIAQSQVSQDPIYGVSGGAQLAMTDMLGNYQYYFLIYNNAQTRDEFWKSFNVALTRANLSRRANTSYGLYHFAGRYFNMYDDFFYERMYGGYFAVSYPLSVFRRIEGSINIRHSDKYWYFDDYSRKALLFSNFMSYVKDNTLWGPTGPIDGERFNLTFGNTIDIQNSNVNFYTIIADYRKYFRVSQQVAHAVRLMTRYNHGKEATRFFMGGSWDLRGYPRWRIWGKKLFLISNEFRFPFIERFIVNFPVGGMAFSSIRGATFVDVGNAWDDKLSDILGSYGLGLRFRLGGVLVLRYDFGKRFYLQNAQKPFDPDTFSKQDGLFHQFFFGWDF
ncbi:PD40 domain-containing protein [candidate division KSB1 bacterium]|nr:PD40 domain-containing protein [candidate division KSB1 bacterium]